MRRRACLLVVLVGCAIAPPFARQQPPDAPVPLRVVVTDARGRSVPGLTAADIEVTEGTRPQKIESVTFRKSTAGRKIALLLDDFHITAGINSARARAALLDFLNRTSRPDDLFFAMKPLDPAASAAPVGAMEELRGTIARFEGRKGNYAPLSAMEAELMSVAPPTAPRQRAQVARAAVQALVTQLSAYHEDGVASRAVIIVSEGFAAEDKGGRERMVTLRTIARSARLGNVAVYVIDPSAAPQTPSPFDEQWRSMIAQTGGVLTPGGASLEAALAQVALDLDEHYIVTLPAAADDGAFHPLGVTVKRSGVTVRAPSGFWTPVAAERLTAANRPAMSTYLRTPHVTGLIQPWFRMDRASAGRTRVTFSWAPRGTRARDAAVEFAAVTFEGVQLYAAGMVPRGSGEGARAVFEASPGAIQVTMAIKDAAGKIVDTEVRYLDVPALDTRGPMIAAVELVRTRTVREFQRVQLDADEMPADTRDFYRQDRVVVRVRAFGPASSTARVTARLLNTRGESIMDLPALAPVGGLAQFDMPLARYASGDYRIEVRAGDATTTTAQVIPFRLIG